jgi:hypothetical protein
LGETRNKKRTKTVKGKGLKIMDPLKNEGILSQIFLMKPSKRPPKITPVGPQAFDGIGMHLVVTVPIVISGPLSVTVLNGLMLALGVIKRAIGGASSE